MASHDLTPVSAARLDEVQNLCILLGRELESSARYQALANALSGLEFFPLSQLRAGIESILRSDASSGQKAPKLDCSGMDSWEAPVGMLSGIESSLLHIVRNFLEHGQKAGADQLSFQASMDAGRMLLSASDNGRGPDLEKIRDKARERRLFPDPILDRLGEAQLFELLFQPQFSTLPTSNAWAGRGMGLDIVASETRRLGGQAKAQRGAQGGFEVLLEIPVLRFGCKPTQYRNGEVLVFAAPGLTQADGSKFAEQFGLSGQSFSSSEVREETLYFRRLDPSFAELSNSKWIRRWLDRTGGLAFATALGGELGLYLDPSSLRQILG